MKAEIFPHFSMNFYSARSTWLLAPMPDCTSSHLSTSYLHHGLADALQRIVDAMLLIVLAFSRRLHSLPHFYLENINSSIKDHG
jgi:hypothetical protein